MPSGLFSNNTSLLSDILPLILSGSSVPMPTPDPRGWSTKLPRIQESQAGNPLIAGEIPPSLLLGALGINPSRKNGDAMDYNSNDIMRSLMFRPLYQWNI